MKKNEQEPNKKESLFATLLPTLIVIVLLFSLFIKPRDINKRETYSVDEIILNRMANQVIVSLKDYNTISYYEDAKRRDPNWNLPDYFQKPLFKHPPVYCFLLTLPKRFGFRTLPGANYFSFCLALLLPLVVFFMAQKLYREAVSMLAFLFLSIEPVYWICSLRVWMECTLGIFMCLSLLFFVMGWKEEKYYPVSGIFLGLAMLTKYPGVLVAPIILTFSAIYKPELFRNKKFYMIFVTAFLLFLPWIIWNIDVYGNFLSNISIHSDRPFISKIVSLAKNPLIWLAGFAVIAFSYKGYFAKAEKTVMNKRISGILAGALLLAFMFSLKGMQRSFMESFSLNALPPVSNMFPSIFGKEPWFFYFGQLLKMSPFYIFSYLGIFLINSKSDGDKLLLISVFFIFLFYIQWGNYQSRYILTAVPILALLGARTFFWLWDSVKNVKNLPLKRSLHYGLTFLLIYCMVKTIFVDVKVASMLLGQGYFTYF